MTKMITFSTVLWALASAAALGQGGSAGGFGGGQGGFGGQGGLGGQQQQQGPDLGKLRGARSGMGGGMGGSMAGGFGGQAMGGGQGMGQGPMSLGDSIRQTEEGIQRYLNGDETKSILTPGEYVEWKLELKANQVVISEARSDAFDPAIEIVDDKGKVLSSNDDRYPGDQRPLLLWRCEHDGNYMLHIRCFHDKSGGQVFSRIRIFDSYVVNPGDKQEIETKQSAFLLRIPMKAGQYKKLESEYGTARNYVGFNTQTVISPIGLPDIGLAQSISLINGQMAILAPVAGDYYVLAETYSQGLAERIKVGTQEILPTKLDRVNGQTEVAAPTNTDAIWEVSAKKGELLKSTAMALSPSAQFVIAEKPDISKYDLSKPETNPFYPHATKPEDQTPAFTILPGRARDGRVLVFFAQKDTKYWLATNASGPRDKKFSLLVKPAAAELTDDKNYGSKLNIGNNDYWSFDAKAGDVMTLKTEAQGFAETVSVREPDLNLQSSFGLGTDETKLDWQMIVQKPGRYFVTVACLGDGGMGDYTLSRKVVHAKEFAYGQPAKGEISTGQTQIWKFTATPDRPLLVHWKSSSWDYGISITDEKGQPVGFQRDSIDAHNQYGILKVQKPQTFVIVLTGNGKPSQYLIELQALGATK